MRERDGPSRERALARLAADQHGVVSYGQLVTLGIGRGSIDHRCRSYRLLRLYKGVFAVGHDRLSPEGRWMAAVLAGGDGAVLSHHTAAAFWGIRAERKTTPDVSLPPRSGRASRRGLFIHRPRHLPSSDITTKEAIPVTTPIRTILDLAPGLPEPELARIVKEADVLGLVTPDALRVSLDAAVGRPGTRRLRDVLDRHTLVLADSVLEERFIPLTQRAGLPPPQLGCVVNGFRVDFFWPELGLVVETDGLRYHRTPASQARDLERDHAHTAAGLETIRFTHAQVVGRERHVVDTLRKVVGRLIAAHGPTRLHLG